ncbi:MAG: 4Fe-4S dicluster domain-containing protein [Calditrichaeota bacterium]|nr:MAG: 4Fe-4S dicluster domain-containing protein [Calditrichota bacterium]
MNGKKRYAMVIDTHKCFDCKACTIACKMENGVADSDQEYRNWVDTGEIIGVFPNVSQKFTPGQCNHCTNAPCVKVCPTTATYRDENGFVRVDYEKCIVCKYCMIACPYDARFVSSTTHTVDKCTFCAHRVGRGELPACVETCPSKTRTFGDLNDPKSEVSKLLRENEYKVLKPETGAEPNIFYI